MSSETLSAAVRQKLARGSSDDLQRAAAHGVFGLFPVVATIALFAYQFHLHAVALDFQVAYWPAVHRLLHGLSPYAVTHQQVLGGTAFVYPALAAVLFAPFGLLSNAVAQILDMLVCLACVPATLRVLGVRDWRIYGLVMLWFPIFDGWQSGNVTLPLMLAVALAWRYRQRPLVAGLLTAVAISVKPFVWPLALWLLATRRWKAAAWAVGFGIVINALVWAVVGYDSIRVFLHLSVQDTDALWRGGFSMLATAHHFGFSRSVGKALLLATSLVAAAGVFHVGLVKRRERDALTLTVVLMLLASPLLWAHYFSLLLIPLALGRPRLNVVWALPVLMWLMPPRQPVHGWQQILAWTLTAMCVAATLTDWMPPLAVGERRATALEQ
jgi:alpha-1,2-mannosyltransferase